MLKVALTGDLERWAARELDRAEKSVTGAVRETARNLRDGLRQQVRSAGLGDPMSRSWKIEPKTGHWPEGRPSLSVAAQVESDSPRAMVGFDTGGLIRSRSGVWLAIPTENAPRRGRENKRITPSNFPEDRFGPLRFVFRRGRAPLLVADELRARAGKRGGFTRASARARARGEVATVVMFILVPQVHLAKRLDIAGEAARWQADLPEAIGRHWQRLGGSLS